MSIWLIQGGGRKAGCRRASGLRLVCTTGVELFLLVKEGGIAVRVAACLVGEVSEVPPSLPLREDGAHAFRAPTPNRLRVADIAEFRPGGASKCYLFVVFDRFDGRLVS